jgi:DNA invertase Pin-like site-specific DNA recombinase
MAPLAQMERELLAERTQAGIDAARRRGRVGDRKRRTTPGKVESARELLKGGTSPRDVALNLGVSRDFSITTGTQPLPKDAGQRTWAWSNTDFRTGPDPTLELRRAN